MSQPEQKCSRRDRRRREMLWAASDVFTAFGYDLANMQAIADSAGVTKATLYAHFGDKEQLFRAVIEYWLEELPEPNVPPMSVGGAACVVDPPMNRSQPGSPSESAHSHRGR